MKSYSSTISVNPSTMSVGEKNFKAMSALEDSVFSANKPFRSSFADSAEDSSSLMRLVLKLIFGVSGKSSGMTAPMDALTLIARIGFGLFIIALSAMGMTGIGSIFAAILGVMVICGCMTRLSLMTLVVTLMVSASSMNLPTANDTYMISAVIGLILAVTGPGHTSVDATIERSVERVLDTHMKRTALNRRDSYRAYEYID
ncbi:MAG: DoxX family protein [Muribaculaceae bacterium]|nr:DoxX family protein [Muribaculaceae bacterium]